MPNITFLLKPKVLSLSNLSTKHSSRGLLAHPSYLKKNVNARQCSFWREVVSSLFIYLPDGGWMNSDINQCKRALQILGHQPIHHQPFCVTSCNNARLCTPRGSNTSLPFSLLEYHTILQ